LFERLCTGILRPDPFASAVADAPAPAAGAGGFRSGGPLGVRREIAEGKVGAAIADQPGLVGTGPQNGAGPPSTLVLLCSALFEVNVENDPVTAPATS